MRFVLGAAIPPHKQKFDAFFSNILAYATPKVTGTPPAWSHIPVAELTSLSGFYDVWREAYAKMAGLHTSADTAVKNEARKTGAAALRTFVQRYLIWDPVTEADRLAMRLPLHDKINTPQGAPVIHVGFSLAIHQIYEILLRFWVLETGKGEFAPRTPVPDNMNGVVVYWCVSDTPITDPTDLHDSKLYSNHISVLIFPPRMPGQDRIHLLPLGKQNRQGRLRSVSRNVGCPIQSIVIP
jgi:hypothetical protein